MKTKGDKKAYFIQRLVAFIIDILLVSAVASLIAIPFVDRKESEKLSKETTVLAEKFINSEISNEEFIEDFGEQISKHTVELQKKWE